MSPTRHKGTLAFLKIIGEIKDEGRFLSLEYLNLDKSWWKCDLHDDT